MEVGGHGGQRFFGTGSSCTKFFKNGETVNTNYPGGTIIGNGGSGAEAGGGGGFIPMEEMVLRQPV